MTFKLIILAIIFVLTSGAFFTDYFKQHKFLVFLAAIMAIISSLFLLQDIVSSIKDDVVADLNTNDTQNHSQQNSFQAQVAVLEAKLEASKKLEQEQQEKEAALQAKLEALKKKNASMPGTVFSDLLADGSKGPEMVWIPAGSFRMGDIQGGGWDDKKPVHEVSVGKFAMGRYEVTVGEYMKFVKATNTHAPEWLEKGSSYNIKTGSDDYYKKFGSALTNENHPIIGVSWYDAVAYTKWLSDQTGKTYRLPTEAEWEYAARAGTETKYWWGNDIGKNKANCDSDCGDNFKYTSPVGSFAANKFGLYDTSGNLWEWTCSEYDNQYNDKEKQCVTEGSRLSRRGGSWYSGARYVRSATRSVRKPASRYDNGGFRVSRQ
jgi:formylglycine-generating enzyme required for sulfatase activity